MCVYVLQTDMRLRVCVTWRMLRCLSFSEYVRRAQQQHSVSVCLLECFGWKGLPPPTLSGHVPSSHSHQCGNDGRRWTCRGETTTSSVPDETAASDGDVRSLLSSDGLTGHRKIHCHWYYNTREDKHKTASVQEHFRWYVSHKVIPDILTPYSKFTQFIPKSTDSCLENVSFVEQFTLCQRKVK